MSVFRKFFLLTVIILSATALSACSNEQGDPLEMQKYAVDEDTFKIFRTDSTQSSLIWESGEVPDPGLVRIEQVKQVLRELESATLSDDTKKLLPDGIFMKDTYFGQDGQLIINFSKSYNSLSTVGELLLRSGYVKTLCQLDFVDYVEFYVEDSPLILRGEVVPGLMKSTDFVDNTGDTTYFSQEVELSVYFVSRAEKMLAIDIRKVTYDGTSSYEKLVTDLLLEGPTEDGTEFLPTVPEGTVINKITSTDGIVYVDVNEAFLNYREDIGEELTIYSIVNSLCDIPGIMKVQITVNGTSRKTIDKYAQSGLIERRPDLIVNEKAGDVNG